VLHNGRRILFQKLLGSIPCTVKEIWKTLLIFRDRNHPIHVSFSWYSTFSIRNAYKNERQNGNR